MSWLDILFLAIALAMDCFTVSVVSGVIIKGDSLRPDLSHYPFRLSLLCGLFQGLMPLIGWVGISLFKAYIEAVDHWIAFALLAFIGGRMVWESFQPEQEHHFNPHRLSAQLLLAVATSIDALAVGISFGCTGYDRLSQLTVPLVVIGMTSSVLSVAGLLLGHRFGRVIARRLKPELAGGIILILIGIKILVTHLAET